MQKKIMLVENDLNRAVFFKHCVSCFDDNYDFDVIEKVTNTALKTIKKCDYEWLVIDSVIGKDLIEKILNVVDPNLGINIVIIRNSNVLIDSFMFDDSSIIFLNEEYSVEDIKEIIGGKGSSEDMVKSELTFILHNLGFPSSLRGYGYLREAIMLMYDSDDLTLSMTKVVYPTIATKFNSSVSRVERSIRHAINVAWLRGDLQLIDKIFGNSISYEKPNPTNCECMAAIVDYLKLQNFEG